ncbi:MAG TPA: carboxypeptidase-like regulatory domain-containing protein [Bryobacteraceae bacterium]|nr:carboxypeptidase-like regulatory domain-containing protein [Bryobacteraceae bacterium]
MSIRRIAVIPSLLCLLTPVARAQPATAALCSVAGQVTDAVTNAPIRKATISLIPDGKPTVRAAISDADGRFQFANLLPGSYSLEGDARGYLRVSQYASNQTRSKTVFSLAPGQTLSDIALHLTPAGAISGRIVDEDGDPVARVNVHLWRITYRNGSRDLTTTGQNVMTDDRGIYRIAGVPPGRYYLSATPTQSAPNSPPDDARYLRTYYPGVFDPAAAAPIDLRPGSETENVNFKLSKVQTTHVRGRVSSAAQADLSLYPENGTSNSAESSRSLLPDGKFDFDGVVPGAYRIRVHVKEGDREAWCRNSSIPGS